MLNINNIRNHKVENNFNAYSPLGGLACTNTHWYLPAERKKSKEKKQKYSFLDKEVIYHEGDPISKVYVIHSGLVKQINYLPNGQARIVRLNATGSWIGLEGLLGKNYEHTCMAIGNVEVHSLTIHELLQHDQDIFSINFGQLINQWHGSLVKADKWISDFSTGEIKPRVARLLSYLAEINTCGKPCTVELLTVNEMAEILGVTSESVSRILAKFKRSGILRKQGNTSQGSYFLDMKRLGHEAEL